MDIERQQELRDQAHQGGRRNTDAAIGELQIALRIAEQLRQALLVCAGRAEVGDDLGDEQAALKDGVVDSLEWRIKELR